MDRVKINYPITADFSKDESSEGNKQFLLKSILASLCGASIPGVIFYFLM